MPTDNKAQVPKGGSDGLVQDFRKAKMGKLSDDV